MEYKFRGKRDDTGEWVYGAFVPDALEGLNDLVSWGFIRNYNREIGKMQTLEVERDTVGQYTGLHDKNGVEVYEGDVVQCWGGEYCQGYWEHSTRDIVTFDPYLLVALSGYEHIEVIGNIHDNPELMEVTP